MIKVLFVCHGKIPLKNLGNAKAFLIEEMFPNVLYTFVPKVEAKFCCLLIEDTKDLFLLSFLLSGHDLNHLHLLGFEKDTSLTLSAPAKSFQFHKFPVRLEDYDI